MFIELGISAYKVRQRNWKSNKEIQLGTGYRVKVPWLIALDDPVMVVHIVCFILNSKGKIVRAGAEAFYVKRNSFFESVLGLSKWINEEDVAYIQKEHRREKLDGEPFAWQVALENLTQYMLN